MTTASTIRSVVEKLISFHDVHKVYADGTVAIDRLNLEVPRGTLTVFVGPSGCGKTTSMRMINRMAEPTSGTVVVDGADIARVDPVRLRLGIGYVIQGAGLMPHQRVIDNVATVPVLKGQPRRAARKAAYTVLERVGLDAKLAARYPAQLSGGEQQRVGVARALAADPPILLMDEPFSAVDPLVRFELQREILRLQAELHKTIVFVTHDIDEAIRLADRVAVFGRGGVLQQYDEPAQLAVTSCQRFRGQDDRRRSRLPLAAVLGCDESADPRHPHHHRPRRCRRGATPRRLGAGGQTRRHAVGLDRRRRRA